MQRKWFTVLAVLLFAGLFMTACPVDGNGNSEWDTEEIGSGTSTAVIPNKDNNNNQGKDEGNGKEPPVVVPPKEDEFQSIPFQVSAALNHMSSTNGHELLTIVRSKEELNRAAETRYHQYWTDTGGPYNVYYLAEATQKYDEAFFTENALVLYLFGASSGGGAIDITQIQRQDSTLTLITDFHMGMMAVISYWTVVIEVAQADVYGVTTLNLDTLKKPPVVVPPEEPVIVPPEEPVIVPPKENDNDGGDTGTFWRASWGGALQGLPSDRYILDSIPSKIVITDTAMLHEFFADTYSLSLNEAGNDWVRDERFSDIIAKYDDTFFESRQLVTFFLTAGGGGLEFKLAGTTYTDGILNINIDYVSIGEGIDALIEWFAIVETNAVPADAAVYVNVTDWLGRVYTF